MAQNQLIFEKQPVVALPALPFPSHRFTNQQSRTWVALALGKRPAFVRLLMCVSNGSPHLLHLPNGKDENSVWIRFSASLRAG